MNKITVDLADGRNFVINSQEGITVTLPSVSTVKGYPNLFEIEKAYRDFMNSSDGGLDNRDIFFAGAKFVIRGGKL